jgi:hypothetical protein
MLLSVALASCSTQPSTTSPPDSRDHALLQFVDMPEGGEVECIGGCEGLAVQWTDRATLRLTPIMAPTSVVLRYRAQDVDTQIRMKIVPADLKICFPANALR